MVWVLDSECDDLGDCDVTFMTSLSHVTSLTSLIDAPGLTGLGDLELCMCKEISGKYFHVI